VDFIHGTFENRIYCGYPKNGVSFFISERNRGDGYLKRGMLRGFTFIDERRRRIKDGYPQGVSYDYYVHFCIHRNEPKKDLRGHPLNIPQGAQGMVQYKHTEYARGSIPRAKIKQTQTTHQINFPYANPNSSALVSFSARIHTTAQYILFVCRKDFPPCVAFPLCNSEV